MTPNDAYEFFVELVGQLFHADVLIAEQADRIEALEAEVARLRRAKEQLAGADVGRRRELFVVVGQAPVTVAGFE